MFCLVRENNDIVDFSISYLNMATMKNQRISKFVNLVCRGNIRNGQYFGLINA